MRLRAEAERLSRSWLSDRWNGIRRPYSAEDVCKLRGTVHPEYTLARLGAEKFERLLRDEAYIPTLGAPRTLTFQAKLTLTKVCTRPTVFRI